MEFRVLGPLEVVDGGHPLALGRPQQRALLSLLLVHRGEALSSERLVDELWGERPPPTAIKIVQGYVSNLRRALGDGVLVTRGHGYLLRAEAGETDADRFEALAAEGSHRLRHGDAPAAVTCLEQALGLWRGPPLADCAQAPFAQPEIARLLEARLAAAGDLVDARLELGEHAQVIGTLDSLTREHPLKERFVAQLMLALYRSGRQAEALDAYRVFRGRLVEELGLEPGRDLRDLQHAILTQDPALRPADAAPYPARERPAPVTPRRRPRAAIMLAAGGALLLATIVAVAVSLAGGGSAGVRVAPNSLAAIDPGSDRVVSAVPVGTQPGSAVSDAGSLWVANRDDDTISRIDPATLRTLATIPVGGSPVGLAAGPAGLWMVEPAANPDANTSSIQVGRLDPQFDTVTTRVKIGDVVPAGPGAVAAAGGSVWVAPSAGLLTRLNATTGRTVQQLDPNASPAGIAVGAGAVWLTDGDAGNVIRVDPTGLESSIPVGNGPSGITVGAGSVWVAEALDGTVTRIDPVTRSVVATIPVGSSPAGVAFGDGSLWVADSGDGTVTRIDPATDRVRARIGVGGSPQAITVTDGRVWVTVAAAIAPAGGGGPGGTLRMLSTETIDSMDPAVAYEDLSGQLLSATCALLLNYPDESAPAGSQLIPEVAQSLPARSDGGRTYTFTIRPGFRFSPPSDQPVTAATFRDAIERTLSPVMRSPWAYDVTDIVGARAYMAGRARHIAGVTVRGDRLVIRLTHPAPDFPARIATSAFCAVPPDTPVDRNGVNVIPSAGPYYVTSYAPGQGVVLTRNPNYHGRRPHHFARIELRTGVPPARAVADIEAGRADYTTFGVDAPASLVTSGLAARLAARYGPGSAAAARGRQQYFVHPAAQLDYFYLNTHRPLFADVRMRRAVNLVLDRRRLAALGSEYHPLPDSPTDHYLPPGIPGYRDQHVYPLSPDIAAARRLADGRGRTAVLYTCNTTPCPEQAQIVKTDLAAIGLRVQIHTFDSATLFTRETAPNPGFDLASQGWAPDYIDPSAMLNALLADPAYGPPLRDPAAQRQLAAAAQLTGPRRYLVYGRLDLRLAAQAAPLAAFGNISDDDFFSARIGCQVYGVYGTDLAALCLRRQGDSR
jgi:YVTN family beta-propeller protein